MRVSSSGTRHSGLVAGLIALHGPEDVEAMPCEAQDRLGATDLIVAQASKDGVPPRIYTATISKTQASFGGRHIATRELRR